MNKMKTFISIKFKQTLLLILSLTVLAIMTVLNSCNNTAERASEKIIKKSKGENANLNTFKIEINKADITV